ncbi:hypothetical protein POV27_08615 [Aureisphaera galaxeae]|uniref:hypothetical protein n=1 Tax=Aureisphaera galaxeae TaxID=1538023 RepID=UPI0023500078|nr:hypothetical protein [Aureisphaera galaxeae]MDC8004113.1 hypothetical protein [Aureisphaera galaxeae]
MILYIVLGIVAIIIIARVVTKYVPVKFAPIISIVLLLISVYLGWQLYNSITSTTRFNKLKEQKYEMVIAKLKDIQASQLAHQEITGNFTGSFDSLVRFIDTAQYAITQRRDSSKADTEKNIAYGLDPEEGGYFIDLIIIDTLGFKPVRDSLFQGTDRYKTMMDVPESDSKFEMKAGKLEKGGTMYSVFEAKVAKEVVLAGQDRNLIAQEKQTNAVDGVNGEFIKVGSMDDVDTSGNWPKLYDKATDRQ